VEGEVCGLIFQGAPPQTESIIFIHNNLLVNNAALGAVIKQKTSLGQDPFAWHPPKRSFAKGITAALNKPTYVDVGKNKK